MMSCKGSIKQPPLSEWEARQLLVDLAECKNCITVRTVDQSNVHLTNKDLEFSREFKIRQSKRQQFLNREKARWSFL